MTNFQLWTLILIGLSWGIWAISAFWIYHRQNRTIQALLDRVMARDYGEFVRAEVTRKEAELNPTEKKIVEVGLPVD